MRKFQGSKRFALGCIIPLVLCVAFAPSYAAFPDAIDGEPLPSLAPILERVTPAVVNISTRGRVQKRNPLMDDPFYRRFFGYENKSTATKSLGSGVIVDAREGLIVTNHHVVESIQQLLVTLNDGRDFQAKVLGSDAESDIAVLQIAANGLTEIAWSDASELRVGDFAIAIGNPYGQGQAVASGVVSALGLSGSSLEGVIQTDASINAANSGGALINLRGQLLGLNTAIVGPRGAHAGIGFALPAKMVRDVAIELLRARGAAASATSNANTGVGTAVRVGNPLKNNATMSDQQARNGRRYVQIDAIRPGSSVEKAGLEAGDIILTVNREKVVSIAQVEELANSASAELKLFIQRGRSTFYVDF